MIVELQLNCTGGWNDYSDFVNVTALTIENSLDQFNDPQKKTTGKIDMFGDAYTFAYAALLTGPNMYSNSICVRLTDNTCPGLSPIIFKLDNQNIEWCDDSGCSIEFNMQGLEPELDCIKNTTIADNTNHVFDQFGSLIHPRFRYCDVIKPTLFFGFVMAIAGILDSVIWFINVMIIGGINGALSVLGIPTIQPIQYLGNVLNGCARAWPAPFIRTYIDNVCNLCGMTADITTAPVFYNPFNPLQPVVQNPYYYATLLTAFTKKGVPVNGTQSYIPNNQPSWTLRQMLGKLKNVWNARWYIHNSKIYFHRKDKIGELIWGTTPALDFTGADKENLVSGVCYKWNGEPKNRRLYMYYAKDATDAEGNQAKSRFDGEYLDTSGNPNYTGSMETEIDSFSTASFVQDGQDSEYDTTLLTNIAGVQLSGTGPLKSTGDTLQLAKIICYDPATPITDARAVKTSYWSYNSLVTFGLADDNYTSGILSILSVAYFNYPMSFAPDQNVVNKNLWQWHEIDKPSNDKKTNVAFECTINYCCQYQSLSIYQRIKMQNGWLGEITFVEFDYDKREINIKGNIL